uniref:Delta(14)-sterol reductase TM7SF2 n=1 Tax=Bos mutus grunniens TaxID=30521 RepID=A0A8B9YT32_BOSMU
MFHLLLVARSGPARLLGPPLPAGTGGAVEPVGAVALSHLARPAGGALPLAGGQELKDKSRLRYPINGPGADSPLGGPGVSAGLPLSALPEMLLPLAFAATLTAFIFSLLLYLKALLAPASALAPGGTQAISFTTFSWDGSSTRICSFDFKYFCELRPGLIGWVLINLALLIQELLYVGDALWYEEAVLTTMDIIHDGFGFMLAFGDLAWVPFTYSLQAQFLLYHPQPLGWKAPDHLLMLSPAVGYYIFRGANSQKNTFRKNPSDPRVADLETISTATGRRLLVSGWWGMVRHPNYLGDLIMALKTPSPQGCSTCCPTSTSSTSPLLVHREDRDERQCRQKYGLAWHEYCRRVPYRIGLYPTLP